MRPIVCIFVALAALASGQDSIARCGPWYSNQACPFNANGLGGQLYCTKFGYCSSTASDESSSGVYTQMDGDCVDQTDMNAYCNTQLSGATCSYAEKRCQISGLDPKKFDGLSGSSTTTTTTTTSTGSSSATTTSGSGSSTSATTTTSSSLTNYPLIALITVVAVIIAAVNM